MNVQVIPLKAADVAVCKTVTLTGVTRCAYYPDELWFEKKDQFGTIPLNPEIVVAVVVTEEQR